MNNFPIFNYEPPIEDHCVWVGAFTPEECESIIQLCEASEFQEKGRTGKKQDSEEGVLDLEVRNSDIVWFHPTYDNDWIHKKYSTLAGRINYDKFQLAINHFDGFQYSKYGVDQHYNWHVDSLKTPSGYRKLSFSLMLTPKDQYKGGDLLLAPGGNNEKSLVADLNQGDLIAFYSHTPHKVTPVTEGERVTLVTWGLGPKLK